MERKFKIGAWVLVVCLGATSAMAREKKKTHPFDSFDHEMHMGLFEGASVACETCHPTQEAYGDRSKMNRTGCHQCHNSPKPILPATSDCALCHKPGGPKPSNHKVDWLAKHQVYAKQDPKLCASCHANAMFCVQCHARRDTVQQSMHRRNFRFFHSIEARANPRRCDACHVVTFCQDCHAGKANSGR